MMVTQLDDHLDDDNPKDWRNWMTIWLVIIWGVSRWPAETSSSHSSLCSLSLTLVLTSPTSYKLRPTCQNSQSQRSQYMFLCHSQCQSILQALPSRGEDSPVPNMASGGRPPCWREGVWVPTGSHCSLSSGEPRRRSWKGAHGLPALTANYGVQLSDLWSKLTLRCQQINKILVVKWIYFFC